MFRIEDLGNTKISGLDVGTSYRAFCPTFASTDGTFSLGPSINYLISYEGGNFIDIFLDITYATAATVADITSHSFPVLSPNQPLFRAYIQYYLDSSYGVTYYRRSIGIFRTINPADGLTETLSIVGIPIKDVVGTNADRRQKLLLVPYLPFDITQLHDIFTIDPLVDNERDQKCRMSAYYKSLNTREI